MHQQSHLKSGFDGAGVGQLSEEIIMRGLHNWVEWDLVAQYAASALLRGGGSIKRFAPTISITDLVEAAERSPLLLLPWAQTPMQMDGLIAGWPRTQSSLAPLHIIEIQR